MFEILVHLARDFLFFYLIIMISAARTSSEGLTGDKVGSEPGQHTTKTRSKRNLRNKIDGDASMRKKLKGNLFLTKTYQR